MARTTPHLLLLILGSFLVSACSAPSTNRIQADDPVKCFWVRADSNNSQIQRLAIINEGIDMKSDPSELKKSEVSRLENNAMQIFIAELEQKGFFEAAKPAFGGRKRKYVSLHIPSGDYYVSLELNPQTYQEAVRAFTGYFNYGDTRFMTGSSTGEAPVDFEKQKDEQERLNQERRNKYR